jgi:hypothetical protein
MLSSRPVSRWRERSGDKWVQGAHLPVGLASTRFVTSFKGAQVHDHPRLEVVRLLLDQLVDDDRRSRVTANTAQEKRLVQERPLISVEAPRLPQKVPPALELRIGGLAAAGSLKDGLSPRL